MFIQKLWLTGLDWNDNLPEDLQTKWISFRNELKTVPEVRISRWLNTSQQNETYELHTFADASTHAYAAVVYLKVVAKSSVHIHLLMSKTRVAPLKKVTVPRLELCAALLAARLMNKVRDTLNLSSISTYMWSDSTTTIWWIRSDPGALKEFMSNRVSQIQEVTTVSDWRYVNTADNPADCASRGLTMAQLVDHHLWWHGPSWLSQPETSWPHPLLKVPEKLSESKPVQATTARIIPSDWFILEKYSTLERLLVITAWCLRFIRASRGMAHDTGMMCLWSEREAAMKFWIKRIQAIMFKSDIAALNDTKAVNKRSKLLKLNPMLDKNGMLCVGGRLRNANIPFSERHPVILPKDNHLTMLFIRQAHQRTLDGGTQATLQYVRQRFWIIDGRQAVKRIASNCVRCFRYKCSPQTQLMGDLPSARCNASPPFMHSGVDFAGPFNIRTTKGRGHRSYKGYVALFVCLATRAVHLELVSDMTTEAFLAALTRYVSVRGLGSDLYSDHGTTFIGANALVQEEIRAFKAQLRAATSYGSTIGLTWHFIPPGAPNFGGIWEAGVKT
ncbi:uncharacterized protein LOC118749948 [Rhagoletis pomonella]|uniref:uncharacterized protein LOC118749948 n=1 Tax=Rhagoletis pomonella TaxID=28610 RepID=UPI00177DECCB|nr:uncharacterized protein LOC118749948 [Rhagoletis pomonella]